MIMMRNQKQQISEENLTLFRSKKRCSYSGGERENLDPIPVDVIINILSKLSGKSMGKFRCVSKLWSSIIRRPYYKELFPIKSPEPPRFLFTFVGGGKLFFYTSPQPQNPDEDSSFVATRHHSKPFTDFSQIFGPVHGLVCHQRARENYLLVVVSNPITGESVTLPKLTTKAVEARSYLGYDPVEKQFKVLCISWTRRGTEKGFLCLEHQVITLENEKKNLLWRKIDCCIPFYAQTESDEGMCINGVLYYTATVDKRMIVCFDVRSERFDLIPWKPSTLINYNGKLGAVDHCNAKNLVLWVLEDAKEQEWSKYVYEKPLEWWKVLYSQQLYVAGVTCGGEVVLCPKYAVQVPFYILLYNFKSNIVVRVRVEVPAFRSFKWPRVHTSPNYVEHVKLM